MPSPGNREGLMAPTVISGPLSRATSALCCPLGESAHLANAEKALVGRLRVGQLCTKMGVFLLLSSVVAFPVNFSGKPSREGPFFCVERSQ